MDKIVAETSRRSGLLSLLGSLGLVAGGVVILAVGEAPLIGWGAIVFFGACAAAFAQRLLDRHPQVVINDSGVWARNLGTIEWSDIRTVWVKHLNDEPFLCVELREPEKYTARLSPLQQRLVKLNHELGLSEIALSVSGMTVHPDELRELVLKEIAVRGLPAA